LLARKASGAELALNGDRLEDLFASSNSGRVSREAVQDALRNAPGLELLRTEEYADIGPRGGENYTSTVYTHPSVKRGPAQAYEHFGDDNFFPGQIPPDPPPLFHTRAAQYDLSTGSQLRLEKELGLKPSIDVPDDAPVIAHHVLEIQSDWAQFRQTLPATPEKRAEMVAEVNRINRDVMTNAGDFQKMERLRRALASNMFRDDFDEQYPAPLVKKQDDWVDAGVGKTCWTRSTRDLTGSHSATEAKRIGTVACLRLRPKGFTITMFRSPWSEYFGSSRVRGGRVPGTSGRAFCGRRDG
jgi:hypothetical protein